MTIKELIDKLKTLPEGTVVMVNGYEGGYDSADKVELNTFVLDYRNHPRKLPILIGG